MANRLRTEDSRTKIEQHRDIIVELADSDLPLNWVAEALLCEINDTGGNTETDSEGYGEDGGA